MIKHLCLAVGLVALTATHVSTAQAPAPTAALTIDSIMRGPELVGNPPSSLRWSSS